MDRSKQPPALVSLCTGYGGLELGLESLIGPVRHLCMVEVEAFACANLVTKAEAGWFGDPPPLIWTDLATFPSRTFRDLVDVLVAGYPCQDHSYAGKRAGMSGQRGSVWQLVRRTIDSIGPRYCILENVDGHVTSGLREVLTDLVESGYRVEGRDKASTFGLFAAAEAGAPHRRKRVFIVAVRDDVNPDDDWWVQHAREGGMADPDNSGSQGRGRPLLPERAGERSAGTGSPSLWWPARPGFDQFWWEPPRTVLNPKLGDATMRRSRRRAAPGQGGLTPQPGQDVADAQEQRCPIPGHEASVDRRGRAPVADSCGERRQQDSGGAFGDEAPDVTSGRIGEDSDHVPAGDGEVHGSVADPEGVLGQEQLRSAEGRVLSEDVPDPIQQGWREVAAGIERAVEPAMGGNAYAPPGWMGEADLFTSVDSRVDELRLVGNGVVPAQAAAAITHLFSRL